MGEPPSSGAVHAAERLLPLSTVAVGFFGLSGLRSPGGVVAEAEGE